MFDKKSTLNFCPNFKSVTAGDLNPSSLNYPVNAVVFDYIYLSWIPSFYCSCASSHKVTKIFDFDTLIFNAQNQQELQFIK